MVVEFAIDLGHLTSTNNLDDMFGGGAIGWSIHMYILQCDYKKAKFVLLT